MFEGKHIKLILRIIVALYIGYLGLQIILGRTEADSIAFLAVGIAFLVVAVGFIVYSVISYIRHFDDTDGEVPDDKEDI